LVWIRWGILCFWAKFDVDKKQGGARQLKSVPNKTKISTMMEMQVDVVDQ
jgi:hypothetical protein